MVSLRIDSASEHSLRGRHHPELLGEQGTLPMELQESTGSSWRLKEPQEVVSLAYELELETTTLPSLGHRLKMGLCREEEGKVPGSPGGSRHLRETLSKPQAVNQGMWVFRAQPPVQRLLQ